MAKETTKRPKPGRPPTGQDGTAVRDYPRVTLRLPQPLAARLRAWSEVSGVPQWALIAQAVEAALSGLPGNDAVLVQRLARKYVDRAGVRLGLLPKI